ncbi:PH domain-containing protein [Actinotalea sp. M2MS4P-6]|uniref:PH domain-containing protein n=1 Tax=Actinotalea sp. M2MS4P-6 TaxID=2983762 RepID=UPI0021E455B9|nr:PH domain-containing protein [Actinotalea sp. M2MS4P-6]MCV2394996.1 PH domain-containing protein [Actinotalea sp. M2MS4P-6]
MSGRGAMPQDPPTGLTWQRVHPVTPLVSGWKVFAVLLVIAAQQLDFDPSNLTELVRLAGLATIVAGVAVVVLIGFAWSALAWRMTRYAIDDETIYLQSGVVFRRQRAARLDRIQGIDTIQPLLARMFGLTELKIEVAGGQDSAVRLAFLRDDEAQRLRNELLARAAGLEVGSAREGGAPTPVAAAPERELVVVPPARVVLGLVRSGAAIVAVLVLVASLAVMIGTHQPAVFLTMIPAVIASGSFVWTRFSSEFNFRLAQSPDGIRLRHGLLEARAQTVPPGRVQAVQLSQPLLWRGRDWWRVEVNIAGYVQQGNRPQETVLLPVATRDEAMLALWLVLPDLGAERAREVLDVGLSGMGPEEGFVGSPSRAVWLDPLGWRRNGYLVTERALLARTGRLHRRLVVVPHERTQSIGVAQGPWQRRLALASVQLHSTPGPVSPVVPHLDQAAAGELVTMQASRARRARSLAGPERWMARPEAQPGGHAPRDLPVAPPGPPAPPAQPGPTPPPPPPPPPAP